MIDVIIDIDQATQVITLSRDLDIGESYSFTVQLDAEQTPVFEIGEAYTLTLKRAGRASEQPLGQWVLERQSDTVATVEASLALESLYELIANRDTLAYCLGVDRSGGGPLGYTPLIGAPRMGGQARRPGDIADNATLTPVSLEEVQALIASIEGLTLSNATPRPLGTASAGTDSEGSPADHVHAMPSAADVGAHPEQTPDESAGIEGSFAPDFGSAITLLRTLVGNVTELAEPTGMVAGVDAKVWLTLGGYTMPAAPAAGLWQGPWDVAGPVVGLLYEYDGTRYMVSAASYEEVSA